MSDSILFLAQLGLIFAALLGLLVVLAIQSFLHALDAAKLAAANTDDVLALHEPDQVERGWRELVAYKGEMEAALSAGNLYAACLPLVGVVGTTMNFFYALFATRALDLGSMQAMEILVAMMDNGMSGAMATTAAAQALYFVIIKGWAMLGVSRFETARAQLDETLAVLRTRLPRVTAPMPIRRVG